MRSPFPGMDPYLEDPAFWPDFHPTFLGCWREAIADKLPEPYEARLNEHVRLVQMPEEVIQLIYPDVAVTRKPMARVRHAADESATTLLEPIRIPHEILEEVKETRIEVRWRADRSLVAVVELLSPWNKTGDGFAEYRAKRNAVLHQAVHLVELDLLVGGKRLPMRRPLPEADYYAIVTRSENRRTGEVYALSLRQPMPGIPIPLRHPDGDVLVDLQSVFQAAFERGRYSKSLPYGQPPKAPLTPNDRAWAVRISKRK